MDKRYILTDDGELYHYGVVGMKWGVRRASKTGGNYKYRSFGTKRYKRIADAAGAKGNTAKQKKYENYYKKSVELDDKMQRNALSNSTGRVAVKTLLTGPMLGGKTYEAVKVTSGNSKYFSRAVALSAAVLSGPIGGAAARALYVRGVNSKSVFADTKEALGAK